MKNGVLEVICRGLVFLLVLLFLMTGGAYVYGWHINTAWRDKYLKQYLEWRMERLSVELTRLNGNPVHCGLYDFQSGDWQPTKICIEGRVRDLEPLQELQPEVLLLREGKITDLSLFDGLPVKILNLDRNGADIKNLAPLKALPLSAFLAGDCGITDLSDLSGMKLYYLDLKNNHFDDISPLKGMPLTALNISGNPVSDLKPLVGMSLISLLAADTNVSDLTPVKGMPLQILIVNNTKVEDLTPVRGIKSLNIIYYNNTPAKMKEGVLGK